MNKQKPGGNRAFAFRGRLSARPGFPPVAVWGAIPHVSTQLSPGTNLTPEPAGPPAKLEHFRR
jgi:hypothetical protein